jgi:hypothetical protein
VGVRLFGQSRRGPVEYLLMGRTLALPSFVATLVSTWYGGVLGVGEYSYRYGLSNWIVFGVPYYLGAALFAIFFARRALLRAGFDFAFGLCARTASTVAPNNVRPADASRSLTKRLAWRIAFRSAEKSAIQRSHSTASSYGLNLLAESAGCGVLIFPSNTQYP